MKKILVLVTSIVAVMIISGCSSKTSELSQINPIHSPIKTDIKYKIIGDAVGEAKGTVLFGIFPMQDPTKKSVGKFKGEGFEGLSSPVKEEAIYNAIESVPGADAIMAPRWEYTSSGFPFIFKTEHVKVKAKAIKYIQ